MKCLAIADRLLPVKDFDAALGGCDSFKEYEAIYWPEGSSRADFRNVIRRLETLGSKAYNPSPEVMEKIKDVDCLFIHQHPVSSEMIEVAKNLKFIISARGGIENIDVDAARQRGIHVINCPAHNAVAVAEYCVGLILCEMRNITRADKALRKGEWREFYPNSEYIGELSNAMIGLVGFGTIGHLVAERLKPFGSEIIVYDPYISEDDAKKYGVRKVEMKELLTNSDVVSLHGRIPKGSPPLISDAELKLMKPTAYLINTARAALLDMKALERALRNREIMGAAIDVFPTEPIPTVDPLLEIDEVTLTNHRGGDTYNCFAKAPVLLVKQLREYLETGKTKFLVV
jgi:D-3-phosphoglycerate dehydrogenase